MVVKAIAAGFAQNVDCTAVYIWIFKDKKSNCAPMCKSLCCKMCKIVLIVQNYAEQIAVCMLHVQNVKKSFARS